MKKLSVVDITNSAQFFPKKGTLEFLQLAFREGFAAIVQAMIGPSYDPALVYVLYGVANSGTYPAYDITEGVVYYNGEIFYVDATTFSSVGSDVAVFKVIQTQYTVDADPVTFSDTTVHNIHNIRKIQVVSDASGGGIADYSAAAVINFVIPAQLNLTATGLSSIGGVYPNLVVNTPAPAPIGPQIVWHGRITSAGATITRLYGSATVSSCAHPGTGVYVPTHNIGNTNYFVICVCLGPTPVKYASFDGMSASSINLYFADDNSYNDTDFQMTIWKFIP